jgi:hypothetical protein
MRTLIVAAGGGGDALGALLLRRLVTGDSPQPLVATLAWERLRVDPLPGPRGVDGFTGLRDICGVAVEVVAGSATSPPGRSALPRLAQESEARLFLLDLGSGVRGLSEQLHDLVAALDAQQVLLVDIGGDVLARGDESQLRSPLADAMTLAALVRTDLPGQVVVAGPGLDGEMPEAEVLDLLNSLQADYLGAVTSTDVAPLSQVLRWHPSEASVLLAAAALGIRGYVETRRGGTPVPLTDHSAAAWQVAPTLLIARARLAQALVDTTSLTEADTITRDLSVSELDYERARAATLDEYAPLDSSVLLGRSRQYARRALTAGSDLITTRRLAEAIQLPGAQTADLIAQLSGQPRAARGALWDLRALAEGNPPPPGNDVGSAAAGPA